MTVAPTAPARGVAGSAKVPVPRDPVPDATLALLRDGYEFISRRCDRLGSDVFATRLMLRSVVCFRGPRGIRLLYGAEGLTRRGAMPQTVLRLLQDKGSLQQVEGEAHRHRKALFMNLLVRGPAARDLARNFRADWMKTLQRGKRVEVLATASLSLARVACAWAGLPADPGRDPAFHRALYLMSARAGSLSPLVLDALWRRSTAEARLRALVREMRQDRAGKARLVGGGRVGVGSPLHRLAWARGSDGTTLSPDEATVEILNLLRPIVAVGRYVAFAALRLAALREAALAGSAEAAQRQAQLVSNFEARRLFAEEVRRISPFFPFVAALTTKAMTHEGVHLPQGQWVIADLWGTLHDPILWPAPQEFRPSRGLDWRRAPEAFCPQGGGDASTTHRCPGEAVTVALIAAAVQVLAGMDWTLPPQDLKVRMTRFPAQPASGVVLQMRVR